MNFSMRATWISAVLVCIVLAGAIFSVAAFPAEEKVILVVVSRPLEPYRNAILGFKNELIEKNIKARYEEFDFSASIEKEADFMGRLNKAAPDLVFAVGTESGLFVSNFVKNVPVVFSMILNPVESGVVSSLSRPSGNVTGVSLNISIDDQFGLMKKMMPSMARVGMLYDAEQRLWQRDKALAAAERKGLSLLALPIHSESGVLAATEKVCGETDFLWAAPDPLIYNATSAQHILLVTLREKKPFMAFSSHYVAAGALVAQECDYEDVGKQAGQIAIKVLGGASPESIPVEAPRKTRLFINAGIAKLIGLDIPRDLLDKADTIIGNPRQPAREK